MKAVRNRRGRIGIFASLAVVAAGLVFVLTAASASLPGSNFEIDTSANLRVDLPAPPSLDWANVDDDRRADRPTGQTDDSYVGSTKEDTACPGETTGSIPNNKSDLLNFGAYTESEADGPGFLNLFWQRVSEPSGTTLMDFELNHSSTNCPSGPNKVRTQGDLLLEYSIDQGGAVATITAREWTGSQWGPKTAIPGQALGTINNVAIPAAESDGLNAALPLQSRTFGEMQIDLDFIFDEGVCESFGSAMLKSRASDSFTSQLKDFIRPVDVNISNCGQVIIHKQTDPDEDPNSTNFGYTKSFDTAPASVDTFTLQDDGTKTFDGVLLGDDYTVTEDVIPAGWDFDSLDCSASVGVTPAVVDETVTFDINSPSDVLECTYTNKARGTIIVEKITDDGQGAFDFTSSTLTPAAFTLTTTGAGDAGKDDETFADLTPGSYDVAETVPSGWNLVSSTCSDGSDPAAISLAGGETVTCTFHNAREKGTLVVEKITDDGQGAFDYTSNTLDPAAFTLTTTGAGDAGKDSRTFSGILAGTYDVDETVPAGWNLVSAACDDGSPITAIDVADGETVTCTFHNERERGTLIVEKITDDGNGAFDYTSSSLDPASFTLTTTAAGDAGKDSRSFSDILAGTYDVAETVPAGWNLVSSTCDDGSPVTAIDVSDGETVTCTFHNARQRGAILIQKVRKHAADGPGDHAQAGVDFTVTGGSLPAGGVDVTTDSLGLACVDNVVLSSLAGDYAVEETVPAGYHAAGATTKNVTVVAEGTCTAGPYADVSFLNIPLTNVTLSVNSQIDGGTASKIDCGTGVVDTGPDGDGSVTVTDLEPTAPGITLTCTVIVDP